MGKAEGVCIFLYRGTSPSSSKAFTNSLIASPTVNVGNELTSFPPSSADFNGSGSGSHRSYPPGIDFLGEDKRGLATSESSSGFVGVVVVST